MGLSLDEISELLKLGDGHCDDVRRVAENQRALVAARIADLAAMQDTLDGLIDRCRNAHPPGDTTPVAPHDAQPGDLDVAMAIDRFEHFGTLTR